MDLSGRLCSLSAFLNVELVCVLESILFVFDEAMNGFYSVLLKFLLKYVKTCHCSHSPPPLPHSITFCSCIKTVSFGWFVLNRKVQQKYTKVLID